MRHTLDLYIAGRRADLSDEAVLLLNYTATDADNPTALRNAYSSSLSLPATSANHLIFDGIAHPSRITAQGRFNPLERTPFELFSDGDLLMRGYLRLDAVHEDAFAVTLYGGLGSFIYELTYGLGGDRLSLADLSWLGGGSAELDFTISAGNVSAAWARLASNYTKEVTQKWDVINFAPMYNGLPGDGFAADKALITIGDVGVTSQAGCSGKGGKALVNFTHPFDEWQVKDLRSYLQRPVVSINAFLKALEDRDNTGGYRVDVSALRDAGLPEVHAWMTLPMLTSIKRKASQALSVTQTHVGGAVTVRNDLTFTAPLDSAGRVEATVNVRPAVSGLTGSSAAHLDLSGTRTIGGVTEKGETLIYLQLVAYDASDRVIGGSPVKCVRGEQTASPLPDIATIAQMAGYTPACPGTGWETVYAGAAAMDKVSAGAYTLAGDVPLTLSAYGVARLSVEMTLVGIYQSLPTGEPFPVYFTGSDANLLYDAGTPCTFSGRTVPLGAAGSYTYTAAPTLRSGSAVTKHDILGGTPAPGDLLVALCRTFGWKMVYNDLEETVKVMPRGDYYDGTTTDISGRIIRDGDFRIEPNTVRSKFLDFALDGVGSAFQEKYLKTQGRAYGSMRVDTGYSFNEDHEDTLEGCALRSAVTMHRYDKYFRDAKVGADRYPMPFIDAGNTYTLWDSATGDSKDFPLPSLPSSATFDPLPADEMAVPAGYDTFFRVQMYGEDGSAVRDGSCALLFLDRWVNTIASLSDDTADMTSILDGQACWLPYYGAATILLPAFCTYRFVDTPGATVIQTALDLGMPRELDMYDEDYDIGATVYERYWEDWIADRLDIDAKRVTCKVVWDGIQVGPDLLRRFWWFDGCTWALDAIRNWTPTGDEPAECDFVRVKDPGAYTGGYVPPAYLRVSPLINTFPAAGGTITLTIEASGSWELTGLPGWLTADTLTGTGNGAVVLTAGPNAGGALFDSFTVSSDDGAAPVAVVVRQEESTQDFYINLSPASISNIPAAGAQYTITILSNDSWTITQPPWIRLRKNNVPVSSGSGNDTITLTVLENDTANPRSSMIRFTGAGLGSYVDLPLAQLAAGAPDVLSVSPSTVSPAAGGGTATLSVTASGTWALSGLPAWITANKAGGSGDGTVILTVAANGSTTSRTATITFTQGALTATVTVTQAGEEPECSVDPASLTFLAGGETKILSISSNTGWSITLPAWLTTTDSLTGTGNATLDVTAAGNALGADRTGNIVVAPATPGDFPSVTVPCFQPAASLSLSSYALSFPGAGGSASLDVTATSAWSITNIGSIPAWLTASVSSGPGGTSTVTFTAAANVGGSRSWSPVFALDAMPGITRTATLGQPAGTISFKVFVKSQNRAADIDYRVRLINNRTFDQVEVVATMAGTLATVSCEAGDDFTVVTAPPANLVQLAWSTASGIVFLRTGRVGSQTFQLSDQDVMDLAFGGRLEFRNGYYIAAGFADQDPDLSTDTALTVDANGGIERVHIALYGGNWRLNVPQGWVVPSATQSNTPYVDFSVAANDSGIPRSASFTINSTSSSSIAITLTINQED